MANRVCQAGFALIELLLVMFLLLLFLSAAVVNLAPLWQGARLDEGVAQLESLLRFVRAEAAQQGRRLQLQVEASAGQNAAGILSSNRAAILVRWEPEPLDQPGVFVQSQSTAALARSVAEHVRIEQVRRLEPTVPSAPATPGTAAASDPLLEVGDSAPAALEDLTAWPAIMFYPDGSSDSAEILVGSADASDPRRVLVKWNGLSGSAARQELDPQHPASLGIGTAEAQPLEPASVARTAVRPSGP